MSVDDDIDLADLDRFTAGFPYEVFDALRREAPVWFHPPTAHTPEGEGFWVLSRYADIVAVVTRKQAVTVRPAAPRWRICRRVSQLAHC